jgi:predicted PurR-regulated permease PerM
MERTGVSPGAAALLIVGALLAGVTAVVLSLAVPASEWVADAPNIGRQIEWKLRDLRGAAEGMREAAEQVDAQVDEITNGEAAEDPDVQRVVVEQPSGAVAIALQAPAVLAQILFTLIFLFFLLASGDMFYEKIVHVLPTFPDKRRAIRIAHDIERKLSRYLFTITLINAGLGVAVGVAMALLGMPNPMLLGVVGFLFNFVPYVGAVISTALVLAVGLVSLPQVGQAGLAAATYFLLTAIEGQFVTPYLIGRHLRLNTVVVFLSVSLWAWLWSVVGMLVATPLLVAIRTLCDHIPSLEPVGDFLSARGDERPEPDEEPAE